jgi:hypothetical protein
MKSITIKFDCKVGIDTSEKSSDNNIYNNTIMNTINGIVVKTGASDNTFHFNKIVNATESGILNVIGDPGTVGNTFENNKLINSKGNTNSTTSTTIAVDDGNYDDELEKEKGKKKK